MPHSNLAKINKTKENALLYPVSLIHLFRLFTKRIHCFPQVINIQYNLRTLVEYPPTSCIMLILAIAGLFYNRYKNEADCFLISSLSIGRSHCPLGIEESAVTQKVVSVFYFHLVTDLCGSGSNFTLGNMGVSVMSVLLLTLFIINNSTKQVLFSGGCLTQCMHNLTTLEIKELR